MKNPLQTSKIVLITFIISTIALSPFKTLGEFNSTGAKAYLLAHNDNPWSTMALTVLDASAAPTSHLKNVSGNSAIDYEAPILAITALNENPRNFGSEDYVAKLKSFHSNQQLGDPNTLNDDIFGILALISSGEALSDMAVSDSKNFILQNQNQDGGWSFQIGSSSDTNMTAAAIVSLIAAGVSSDDPKIQNGISYLRQSQNNDGGFPYDPQSPYGTNSDSSSTAWVIWALSSLKINPSSWTKPNGNPVSYLESNQTQEGFFKYQTNSTEDAFSAVTTAYAVIALSGKTLPLHIFSNQTSAQTFAFRIESSTGTVCEGQALGPTAMDIIKNASGPCGFSYHIKETAFGPYLDKIGNDEAAGLTGWLYLANNTAPSVGAADYVLKSEDEVLWYFGDFGWQPTRLTLSSSEISNSQIVNGKVEYFDGTNWSALEGATVYLGVATTATDDNGQFNLNATDGYYKVYAQKTDYIRSNSVLLKIGQPPSTTVGLHAEIISGQTQGTSTQPSTLSFIVEPSSLDFGALAAGASVSKNLTIRNTGLINIQLESAVSGAEVFRNYLFLENKTWRKFQTNIEAGQDQQIETKLAIPTNFQKIGSQSGQLVFWASPD